MKILSVIVGLALTAGGVYLAYDTFMLFDDLETMKLGLLLGASFLAMTIGLYLFLLPLAMRPKSKKNKKIVEHVEVEHEVTNEIIRETDALHVIEANEDIQEPLNEDKLSTLELFEEDEAKVIEEAIDLDKTKAFEVIFVKICGMKKA